MPSHPFLERVPVLIVGGGPVGLALAADLGWRGVKCLLVERTDGSIDQPKTNEVNIRSMEFCRRWGIVETIEQRGYPRDHPHDQVYCTNLTGYEISRHPILPFDQQTPPPTSPQKKERCPQLTFDPILAEYARSRPSVTLRYRCQFESFVQRPDGVECELTDGDTGRKTRILADYVAACDGGNSRIRDALGIKPEGVQVLAYSTNVLFTADLQPLHDKGRAVRFLFIEPNGNWANLMCINGKDRWRLQFSVTRNRGTSRRSTFTPASAVPSVMSLRTTRFIPSSVGCVARSSPIGTGTAGFSWSGIRLIS